MLATLHILDLCRRSNAPLKLNVLTHTPAAHSSDNRKKVQSHLHTVIKQPDSPCVCCRAADFTSAPHV